MLNFPAIRHLYRLHPKMANASRTGNIKPVSSPEYRQLDRSKNEFRLLKILPPVYLQRADASPLDFSPEPVRCELQYESLDVLATRLGAKQSSMNSILDYILQDIPTKRANDSETDTEALMELLGNSLGSKLSVDTATKHEISSERKEALQILYEISNHKLRMWCPDGIQLGTRTFEDWLSTWLWTPLSGDPHHLEHRSYVWRDQTRVTLSREQDAMIAASGLTMRQALELAGMAPEEIEQLCGRTSNSANDSVEITIDGIPVLVGRNLEKALRTLREIPEISRGTRVWVDALCINQQDVEEKNIEVARMGEIYRNADRVVSYLGDERDQSGQILEFMDAIGTVMQNAQTLTPIIIGFLKNIQADMAASMARLFLRTYFSRIWIVQEIVLGGKKSIIICGARRFSWTNLLRCGNMLSAGMAAGSWNYNMKLDPMQGDEENFLTMADLKDGITKLQMLRDAHIDSKPKEDESDRQVPRSNTIWFRIPSSNNATDSRDLIYGMMSLLPMKLTRLIHVEYASHNKFVDVMRGFAEAHITSTQSLYWILHRYYSPFLGHKDWPTWVPNLAQQFSSTHWDWPLNLQGNACPNVHCDPSFATARDNRKHLLVCGGKKLGTIHMVTSNLVTDTALWKRSIIQMLAESLTAENAEQVYPMMESLQRSIRLQQSLIIPEEDRNEIQIAYNVGTRSVASTHRYGDIEGLKMALNECFGCFGVKLEGGQSIFNFPFDMDGEQDEALNQVATSREFMTPMVTSFNMLREFFGDFNLWGTSFSDLFPVRTANVDPASFSVLDIKGNAMTLAHLFTTSDGFVGTCLSNIQAGDELFLLAGCHMPVLLKKSAGFSGAYELRGGVYIPGLISGEALDCKGRPEDDFETVLIC
jgi:hypothetical protein